MMKKEPSEQSPAMYQTQHHVHTSAIWVMILFFVFMLGYFAGRRYMLHEFDQYSTHASFADHIHTMVDAHYREYTPEAIEDTKPFMDDTSPYESSEPKVVYKAKLIGFGKKKFAQNFVDRIQRDIVNQPFDLEIKERVSTTKRGKEIIWFQVVTTGCIDRDILASFVQKMQKQEHLQDASIVDCYV